MFKKTNSTPPAKQSAFTGCEILSDIATIMKQHDYSETVNPFTVNHTELWYAELKDFSTVTNDLIDAVEIGADKRDELLKLKKDLEKGSEKIRQKAKEALECK